MLKRGLFFFAIYSKQVKEDHSVLFPPSFRYAVREPQSFRARITIAAPKNRGLFQSVQKHRISAKKRIWRATDASRLKTRIFSPTGVDLPKSAHTRKILRSAQCADAYFTNCANFNQFSAKAKIGDFDEGDFPYPRPENVITKTYRGPPPPPPPYEVATRSYRGTHRKGIRDARPSSSSATTRAREAPEDPFSPPQQTMLPDSINGSVKFSSASPKEAITTFRRTQLQRIESLANKHGALADRWLGARHPFLKTAEANQRSLARSAHAALWHHGPQMD